MRHKPPASVVRQWREAAEPKHAAAAKAADFLIQDLHRMEAAYRSGGDDGLAFQMRRSIAYRQRRPDGEPPDMPPFRFAPRQSLYELRPSALLMVEEYGHVTEPSIDVLRRRFTKNYTRIFGQFRRRGDPEVPSDAFKKEIMIEKLIGLIKARRAEYAAERAKFEPDHASRMNAA